METDNVDQGEQQVPEQTKRHLSFKQKAGLGAGAFLLGSGVMDHRKTKALAGTELSRAGEAVKANLRLANLRGGDLTHIVDQAKREGVNLQHVVANMGLSGEQIANLTKGGYGAQSLGVGQNLKALGAQTKGLFEGGATKAPKRIYNALSKGMSETGGGWRQSSGTMGRYLPWGVRAQALKSSIPEFRDAFKSEDTTGQGRSQTERVGRAVGTLAGGLATNLPASVTNRLGFVGNAVVGLGASALGSKIGGGVGGRIGKVLDKGVSKVRGVASGDTTNQLPPDSVRSPKRLPGSTAV